MRHVFLLDEHDSPFLVGLVLVPEDQLVVEVYAISIQQNLLLFPLVLDNQLHDGRCDAEYLIDWHLGKIFHFHEIFPACPFGVVFFEAFCDDLSDLVGQIWVDLG